MKPVSIVIAVTLAALPLAVACGGSSFDGSQDGGAGAAGTGTGGTSGGTGGTAGSGAGGNGGSGGVDCSLVDCPGSECAPGFTFQEAGPNECCGRCLPEPGLCSGTPEDCQQHPGCAQGYTRVEYAPGCCACEIDRCGDVLCEAPSCGPGERLEFPADGCCPVCVPNAQCDQDEIPCDLLECPPGFIGLDFGNGCCFGCTPDPEACAPERQQMAQLVEREIAARGALDCASDNDCVLVSLSNECTFDCGTSLAAAHADAMMGIVEEFGKSNCSHCPPHDIGCPAVVLEPRCNAGQCGF